MRACSLRTHAVLRILLDLNLLYLAMVSMAVMIVFRNA